jgi:hypothetical protein
MGQTSSIESVKDEKQDKVVLAYDIVQALTDDKELKGSTDLFKNVVESPRDGGLPSVTSAAEAHREAEMATVLRMFSESAQTKSSKPLMSAHNVAMESLVVECVARSAPRDSTGNHLMRTTAAVRVHEALVRQEARLKKVPLLPCTC